MVQRSGKIENVLSIKGVDNASQAIKSAGRAMLDMAKQMDGVKEAAQETEESTTSWFDSLANASNKFNEIVEAGGNVIGSLEGLADSLDDAVKHAQQLVSAFGSVDEAYRVAAASGFAFSMEGLASGVNMLKRSHIPISLTAEQLQKLGAMAEQMGTDGDDALRIFGEAIAKAETSALEQLGIFVKTEDAIADYAKAHGLAADALDQHSKKIAVHNLAMKELKAAHVKVTKESDAWERATNKLDMAWSAFRAKIIAPLATAAGKVIEFFTPASIDRLEQGRKIAIKLGATLRTHLDALKSINELVDKRVEKTKEAQQAELDYRAAHRIGGDTLSYSAIVAEEEMRVTKAMLAHRKWNEEVTKQKSVLKIAEDGYKKHIIEPIKASADAIKTVGRNADFLRVTLEQSLPGMFPQAKDTLKRLNLDFIAYQENVKKHGKGAVQTLIGQLESIKMTEEAIGNANRNLVYGGLRLQQMAGRWQKDLKAAAASGVKWLNKYRDAAGNIIVPLGKMGKLSREKSLAVPARILAEQAAKELENWKIQIKAHQHTITTLQGKEAGHLKTVATAREQLARQDKARQAAQDHYNNAIERTELRLRNRVLKVVADTHRQMLGVVSAMTSWAKRSDIVVKGISRQKVINRLTKMKFQIEKSIALIQIERDKSAIKAQVKILKARTQALAVTMAQAAAAASIMKVTDAASAAVFFKKIAIANRAAKEMGRVVSTIGTAQGSLKVLDEYRALIQASTYRRGGGGGRSKGAKKKEIADPITEKFLLEQSREQLQLQGQMTDEKKRQIALIDKQIKMLAILQEREKALLAIKAKGFERTRLRQEVISRGAIKSRTVEMEYQKKLKAINEEAAKARKAAWESMDAANFEQIFSALDKSQKKLEQVREAATNLHDILQTGAITLNEKLSQGMNATFETATGGIERVVGVHVKSAMIAGAAVTSTAKLAQLVFDKNVKFQHGMITALGASLTEFFKHEHERSAWMAGVVALDGIASAIRTGNLAYIGLGAAAAAGYGVLAGVQYSKYKKEQAAKAQAEQVKAGSVKPIKAQAGAGGGGAITYVFNAPIIGGHAEELAAQMEGMKSEGSGSGFAGGGI